MAAIQGRKRSRDVKQNGAVKEGKTPAQAQQYLSDLFHHVPVQDDKASAALQTFTGGKGDALLSYENDAIFAQQNGQDLDYTIPNDTILIENPVAVTTTTKHPEQARAHIGPVLWDLIRPDRPVPAGRFSDPGLDAQSMKRLLDELENWSDLIKDSSGYVLDWEDE